MRYWQILVFCLGISLDVFGAAVCQGAVLGELRRRRIAEAKKLGGEVIAFLHYPPISLTETCHEIYDTLVEEQIRNCYYGHLHGNSVNWAFRGESDGVNFDLISADYLSFCPKLIRKF